MKDDRVLRAYIREVLTGFDTRGPGIGGKGGNNLFVTGDADGAAGVRPQASSNVMDDEDNEEAAEQQDEKAAACCLILSADGRVLAVSRKDDPTAFGLPGGKVDPGETPMQAAARELQEETGLVTRSLHQVFVRRDGDGFVTYTFACECEEGQFNTEETGAVRWVTPQTLFDGPFGDYNRMLWAQLGLPK